MARIWSSANFNHIESYQSVMPASNFTLACWAYPTTYSNAFAQPVTLIGSGYVDGSAQMRIGLGGNLELFSMNVGEVATATGVVPLNQWSHAVVTYDGTNTTFWIAGQLSGTSGNSVALTAGNHVLIGACALSENNEFDYFDGPLADAAVWNKILTSSQIALLAAGTRPGAIEFSSLAGWWPILGNQSPEPDFSANGNLGILQPGPAGLGQVADPPLLGPWPIPPPPGLIGDTMIAPQEPAWY